MIKRISILNVLLVAHFIMYPHKSFSIGLTRITTIGTTDVALGSDPCESSSWFPDNPASKLQLHYNYFLEIEMRAIMPDFTYESSWGRQYKSKNNDTYMAPAISYTQKINKSTLWGIDAYANYGFGAHFERVWDIVDSKLTIAGIYIKPFISSRITEHLFIGGGPVIVLGTIHWNGTLGFNNLSFPLETNLDALGIGLGFQVGVMYQINDKFALGANYLSSTKVRLESDQEFHVAKLGIKDNVTLEFEFPDNLDFSFGYKPKKDWLLVGQITYFGQSHNSLYRTRLDFNHLPIINPFRLDWESNLAFYLGASHKINEKWALGGGITYMSESLSDYSDYFAPDINGWALGGRLKYSPTDKFSVITSFLYCWGDGEIFHNRLEAEVWTFGTTAIWHF